MEDRRRKGINSISAALDTTGKGGADISRAAPAPPQQKITVSGALDDTIAVAPDTGPMRQSFETSALNMLEAHPAETGEKYPELLQWRDVTAKARAAK